MFLPLFFLFAAITQGPVTATIQDNGSFSVTVDGFDAPFTGRLPSGIQTVMQSGGIDGLGPYTEVIATTANGSSSIRVHANAPAILLTNIPEIASHPALPYQLGYNGIFALKTFNTFPPYGPWVFFDGQRNTFVVSPAAHFDTTHLTHGVDGSIQIGTDDGAAAGSNVMLVYAGRGIGATIDGWGHALTMLEGKPPIPNDADAVLERLGYWTDAGASYYYNFDGNLGYPGTLLAIRDEFKAKGVPIAYVQLDSWFYPKGPNALWSDNADGIYRYVADAALFPQSLETFQTNLALPLVTHARWIDAASPYRSEYSMAGNIITDPLYWTQTASYLKNAGVIVFEQDWLGAGADAPANARDAFLSNMATAMSDRSIAIQYCMPLPRHLLQSTAYQNVRTARVSEDRFNNNRWDEFVYGSQLASALGLYPWADVFFSTERDNLLIATLSAGPVGVGDALGQADAAMLLQAVRADGVIVKPDAPLVPMDKSIVADEQSSGKPMLAWSHTDFGDLRAAYIFAYARGSDHLVEFTPADLGMTGPVFIYDAFAQTGAALKLGETFTTQIGSESAYYVVVPIGMSGIALIGDAGQFVPWGKKRLASLSDDGQMEATVQFAAGERTRTLLAYARVRPSITGVKDGAVVQTSYDRVTGLYRITMGAGHDGIATVRLKANPVEHIPERHRG